MRIHLDSCIAWARCRQPPGWAAGRCGAVQLTWALPRTSAIHRHPRRVAALVAEDTDEMTTLNVTGAAPADTERLVAAFQAHATTIGSSRRGLQQAARGDRLRRVQAEAAGLPRHRHHRPHRFGDPRVVPGVASAMFDGHGSALDLATPAPSMRRSTRTERQRRTSSCQPFSATQNRRFGLANGLLGVAQNDRSGARQPARRRASLAGPGAALRRWHVNWIRAPVHPRAGVGGQWRPGLGDARSVTRSRMREPCGKRRFGDARSAERLRQVSRPMRDAFRTRVSAQQVECVSTARSDLRVVGQL